MQPFVVFLKLLRIAPTVVCFSLPPKREKLNTTPSSEPAQKETAPNPGPSVGVTVFKSLYASTAAATQNNRVAQQNETVHQQAYYIHYPRAPGGGGSPARTRTDSE